MKILIPYDNSGPKYHRLLVPVSDMPDVEFTLTYLPTEEQVKDIDILFFNRLIPGVVIEQLLEWKDKYGFSIITDFDDHWILGKDHYLFERYKRSRISETLVNWIKLADAVFVTHERLFNEVFQINKNVHILPNAIPEFDQFSCKKIPSDLPRLFWAGGITHKNDLKLLKRPLQLINRNKVKFVLGGYQNNNPEWDEMAKIFTTGSSYNTEVLEALPVNKYYYMYAKCDIALIPLIETKFNSYKSNLKILEAANIGAPVIVSRVHPYLGFPEDLVNYADAHSPWFKQIKKLLVNPEEAKDQGQKLKEYCRKVFNFKEINERRKQIFYETRKQKELRDVPAHSYQQGGE